MKEMLLEVVEKILKKHVQKETVDLLEDGLWPENLWRVMEENELTKVAWQQSGGDLEDLLLLYERMGYYTAPLPFIEQTLANVFLEQSDTQPIEEWVTFGFDTGELTVTEDMLSGVLPLVRWGRFAKKVVVIREAQLVLVDCARANVTQSTNLAAEPRDTLTFSEEQAQIIPLPDELSRKFRALESAALVAQMTGAIARAVDLSVQFSKERQQFGQPIHRFQLVQQHLALLAGERAIATAALENIMNQLREDDFSGIEFARIRLDDAVQRVTTSAHQVHAAIGVTFEHSLHQATRRLWAWRDEGEAIADVCANVANKLLNNDGDVWSLLTKGDA